MDAALLLWERHRHGNMSTAELAAEVAMLDSAELPEHKDWNDDLKIVYNITEESH